MALLVVDTSAAIATLTERTPDPRLRARIEASGTLCAPHLIDVEFLNALRRLVGRRVLNEDRATDARSDFAELAISRFSHEPLGPRIWALRSNLSAYDAAFVALAEALGAPLVTCDAGLAAAPGHGVEVELFAPAL